MRILIYTLNYYPELTGIGKYSGEMAAHLAKKGHAVRVVTSPPYYPAWKIGSGYRGWSYRREEFQGVMVTRCPLWVPRRPGGLKRILHLASFAVSSFPVVLLEAFRRPDIIFAIEPALFCAPAAILSARLGGARAWLHVQDFEVDAAFDLGLIKFGWARRIVTGLERWLMKRFARVSTISARMLVRLTAKGVQEDQRVLFPNWVDTNAITPLPDPNGYRRKLGLSADAIVALYSGNMGEKQGLEIIVEAARILRDSPQIVFIMCGAGAAHERLRQMAAGMENVKWIPLKPIQEFNELLNAADIHLLPQLADAADLVMPSKLGAMLASGRPVVATASLDTEIAQVVDGRGVVVPPGDAAAFAKAVLDLGNDVARRAALSAAARAYAVDHLDQEAVLGRFETALMHVITKKVDSE